MFGVVEEEGKCRDPINRDENNGSGRVCFLNYAFSPLAPSTVNIG